MNLNPARPPVSVKIFIKVCIAETMDELHKRLLHPWTLKKKDLVDPLKKKDHVRLNSVPMENMREYGQLGFIFQAY